MTATKALPRRIERLMLLREAREAASSGLGRQIREAAGLSVQSVAEAVGVSKPCVSRWERGLTRPTGRPAVRWIELLHILQEDRLQ